MRLFILGNGFDLHHKLPTALRDFKAYVKRNHHDIYEKIDDYLPVDEYWAELENSFRQLDYEGIFEAMSGFLVSYGADDWRDSYHHDFQYEVEQVAGQLSSELVSALHTWLTLVSKSDSYVNCTIRLPITVEDTFITFNYTHVLKDFYKIDDSNIFHVHGSLRDGDEGIVLGHDWDGQVEIRDPEDQDSRYLEAVGIINEFFSSTFKPSSQIIADNGDLFKSVTKYEKIYILGHSLNDVDMAYLDAIKSNANPSAEWYISYFNDSDRQRVDQFVCMLNFDLNKVTIGSIGTLLPSS